MKFNWNFQRAEGGLRINLFCWGGMDNLWNYTISSPSPFILESLIFNPENYTKTNICLG